MRVVLLVAVLILAGCARAPEPEPAGATPAPMADPAPGGDGSFEPPRPCATLTLVTDRASVAPGEALAITAILRSCDHAAHEVRSDLCSPAFEITLPRGSTAWRVPEGPAAGAAVHAPRSCPMASDSWGPAFLLPPGGEHRETFLWNGSFETDPCDPPRAGRAPSCLQWMPAEGEQPIHARAIFGDHGFDATARVLALPPSAPSPRLDTGCGLTLRAEPATIAPGEEAAMLARFVNCGGHEATIGDSEICGHANGFELILLGPNGTAVRPGASGAAGGEGIERGCLAMVPTQRVVPAGGYVDVEFGWNGTLYRSGACGADGCSTTYYPAPPGEYEATLTTRTWEGGSHEAKATLVVRSA